jgi:hypothetical protein
MAFQKGYKMVLKRLTLSSAAAMLILGIASASASTVSYTFAQSDGTPYCDGVTLKETGFVAVGTHTAHKLCTEGDNAGGFYGKKVLGSVDTQWIITTTDVNNASPTMVEVFVLDPTAETWQLYEEDTANGVAFALTNSGVLLNGTPKQNGQSMQKFGTKGIVSGVKK